MDLWFAPRPESSKKQGGCQAAVRHSQKGGCYGMFLRIHVFCLVVLVLHILYLFLRSHAHTILWLFVVFSGQLLKCCVVT